MTGNGALENPLIIHSHRDRNSSTKIDSKIHLTESRQLIDMYLTEVICLNSYLISFASIPKRQPDDLHLKHVVMYIIRSTIPLSCIFTARIVWSLVLLNGLFCQTTHGNV